MDKSHFIWEDPRYKEGELATHALLLQFDKPITRDLYLPNERNLLCLMYLVNDTLLGKVEKGNYFHHETDYLPRFEALDKINSNVGKIIREAFWPRGYEEVERAYRNESWFVAQQVLSNDEIFAYEPKGLFGCLGRYRDGERERHEIFVAKELSHEERKAFKQIGEIIVPYMLDKNKR